MSKHTATPWELGGESRLTHGWVILSPTGEPVAEACDFNKYDRDTEKVANATHIVRCVNAHDELVKALEATTEECNTATKYSVQSLRGDMNRIAEIARAALAKARA